MPLPCNTLKLWSNPAQEGQVLDSCSSAPCLESGPSAVGYGRYGVVSVKRNMSLIVCGQVVLEVIAVGIDKYVRD